MSKNDRRFYEQFLEVSSESTADGAIGELRRRLVQALNHRPDDLRLLVQGANVLVRAAADHSMSARGRKRLADSMEGMLKGLGDQLAPGA